MLCFSKFGEDRITSEECFITFEGECKFALFVSWRRHLHLHMEVLPLQGKTAHVLLLEFFSVKEFFKTNDAKNKLYSNLIFPYLKYTYWIKNRLFESKYT